MDLVFLGLLFGLAGFTALLVHLIGRLGESHQERP